MNSEGEALVIDMQKDGFIAKIIETGALSISVR
jgi:hypothetical protein